MAGAGISAGRQTWVAPCAAIQGKKLVGMMASVGITPADLHFVLISHSHEDHIAGNGLFAEARVHVHADDLPGVDAQVDPRERLAVAVGETESLDDDPLRTHGWLHAGAAASGRTARRPAR